MFNVIFYILKQQNIIGNIFAKFPQELIVKYHYGKNKPKKFTQVIWECSRPIQY